MSDTRNRGNVSEKSSEKMIDSRSKEILEDIFKSKDILMDQQVIAKLRKKLPDQKILDTVFEYYKKRLEHVKNKSNKFKIALLNKYQLQDLSTSEIIKKALKYTNKYNFTSGEFQMFMNLVLSDHTIREPNLFTIPTTPMSKTLGYNADAVMGDKLNVDEDGMEELGAILKTYDDPNYKQLHKQTMLQSLMYRDLSVDAMSGSFDKAKNSAYDYIHPIVAALFLPKIPYLEERVIMASIADIVHYKEQGMPIMTQPEYDLYWDLINDPNQTVCVSEKESPIKDLHKRVILQVKLWDSIMQLRQGKYYGGSQGNELGRFFSAIGSCKSSIFDAPDLLNVNDEGTILRRILNALSLRPTIVNISSLANVTTGMTTLAIAPAQYSKITSIPIINLRLPRSFGTSGITVNSVNLESALYQPEWFIEGKTLVPKSRSIVYSKDVLFFYVDRRYKAFNYASINRPNMFAGLPPTLSGLDCVNELPVTYNNSIDIGNNHFILRSVIFIETSYISEKYPKLITGCSAGLVRPACPENGNDVDIFYRYDPCGAAVTHVMQDGTAAVYTPVHELEFQAEPERLSFSLLAEKRGSIFMYAKH